MVRAFSPWQEIPAGKAIEVTIAWNKKLYKAQLRHVQQQGRTYHTLRFDTNPVLLTELKKEFVQTYLAAFSQELKFKSDGLYHRTNLDGGNQEILMIKPITVDRIDLETLVKVATPYDELFKRMIDENVFGWLSSPDKADAFIQSSTDWIDISKLKEHKDSGYVVYYLLDEAGKKLYIGSAKTLGERVKPGRAEIPNWNKFRYDIIKPEHHSQLVALEYFSIMSFARILNNAGNKRTLGIADLTLVNKDYRYYS
jgi:hypothetical protein